MLSITDMPVIPDLLVIQICHTGCREWYYQKILGRAKLSQCLCFQTVRLQNAHLFLYILPDFRVIFAEMKENKFFPQLNTYVHFTPRLERAETPRGQFWNETSKLH